MITKHRTRQLKRIEVVTDAASGCIIPVRACLFVCVFVCNTICNTPYLEGIMVYSVGATQSSLRPPQRSNTIVHSYSRLYKSNTPLPSCGELNIHIPGSNFLQSVYGIKMLCIVSLIVGFLTLFLKRSIKFVEGSSTTSLTHLIFVTNLQLLQQK